MAPLERLWVSTARTTAADATDTSTLTVVTYNVLCDRYVIPADGHAYASSAALDWRLRRERVMQELSKLDGDIVCLQVQLFSVGQGLCLHLCLRLRVCRKSRCISMKPFSDQK